MEFVFFVPFVLVIGGFVFKIVKHGGLRAALYGAPLGREIGELPLSGGSVPARVIRVRVLHGTDKQVGIELAAKGPFSYTFQPIAVSRSDARKLSEWLAQAAGD